MDERKIEVGEICTCTCHKIFKVVRIGESHIYGDGVDDVGHPKQLVRLAALADAKNPEQAKIFFGRYTKLITDNTIWKIVGFGEDKRFNFQEAKDPNGKYYPGNAGINEILPLSYGVNSEPPKIRACPKCGATPCAREDSGRVILSCGDFLAYGKTEDETIEAWNSLMVSEERKKREEKKKPGDLGMPPKIRECHKCGFIPNVIKHAEDKFSLGCADYGAQSTTEAFVINAWNALMAEKERESKEKKPEDPKILPCICGKTPEVILDDKGERKEWLVRCKCRRSIWSFDPEKEWAIKKWNRDIEQIKEVCEVCGATYCEDHKPGCPKSACIPKFPINWDQLKIDRYKRIFLEDLKKSRREIPKRVLRDTAKRLKRLGEGEYED